MKLSKIDLSSLRAIAHDEEYSAVEPGLWEDLQSSDSLGSFYNQEIKGYYPSAKIASRSAFRTSECINLLLVVASSALKTDRSIFNAKQSIYAPANWQWPSVTIKFACQHQVNF